MKTLHLSNIANNSYLNAKILNENGIESDVLSLDYYHIMGCPEWEDADFIGDHKDDFFPDWHKVDLNGFQRPSWFIQAAKLDGINYLLALNENKIFKIFYYNLKIKSRNLLNEISNHTYRSKLSKVLKLFKKINGMFRKCCKLLYVISVAVIALLLFPLTIYIIYMYKKNLQETKENQDFFLKKIEEIKANLKVDFPDRYAKFDFESLNIYETEILLWRKLFKYYDKVYAYGIDGIFPLLAGKEYIAFEHGTLRKLPYDDDYIGLITLLSYKYANGVLITNADNIVSAKKLKLKNYIFIPHPVNEEPILKIGLHNDLDLKRKYNTDFLIYHPSRQHWNKEDRDLNYEKGNDIFINGLALFIKNINPQAKAIFSEWGMMVEQTKQLLKYLDIADNIIWLKPVHNYKMTKIIQSVDLVADQFFLGSFGDIMPKACLSKKPTMMYLNEELHKWCFDEMPPIINVSNENDVLNALTQVYNNRLLLDRLSKKASDWYNTYHSNHLILNKLLSI